MQMYLKLYKRANLYSGHKNIAKEARATSENAAINWCSKNHVLV